MHLKTFGTVLAALAVLYLAFVIGGLVLRLLIGLAVLALIGAGLRRLLLRQA
jgi:hypothetical protein